MPEAFGDTSGWASFFVRTEKFHALAEASLRQWQANGTRLVTTNYVLVELIALFSSPLRIPRADQIKAVETIRGTSWVEVVHIDPNLDAMAWTLLRSRPDKDWSLVDCTSFVVMQQRGITAALTADHHFEQAGFVRLLR